MPFIYVNTNVITNVNVFPRVLFTYVNTNVIINAIANVIKNVIAEEQQTYRRTWNSRVSIKNDPGLCTYKNQ